MSTVTVPSVKRVDDLEARIVKLESTPPTPQPTPTPTPQPTGKTALYVPLFTYPTSSTWTTVSTLKMKYPTVQFIVTINPSSGVGTGADSNFVNGINKLKNSNTLVLGYVYTLYGDRPINDIKTEIDKYKQWYNVGGIFLDEMDNQSGKEQYYKDITAYVKSVGMSYVMGNPGTSTTSAYAGTVDNVLIYESSGAPSLSTVQQRTNNGQPSPSKYGIIPYGVSVLDTNYVKSIKPYVGTLYITNDSGSNPWDSLPSYLDQLCAILV